MKKFLIKIISCFILNRDRRKKFRKKWNSENIKRREILKYYKNNTDLELQKVLDYMKEAESLEVFNSSEMKEYYINLKVESTYDQKNKMYFVNHHGKKMYLRSSFDTKEKAENYYKSLLLEQYLKSPHRYLTEKFNLNESKCLVDCGGAEGIFTLENIDNIEKAYIFECDKEWVKALKLTFEQYKNKVEIIEKFVSDKDTADEMTIDKLQTAINDKIDFIKMDIEGAELKALNGAKDVLKKNKDLKWVICCYHNQDDEKEIRKILKDFNLETTKGYMLFWYNIGLENLKPPYFRRGIIRASKI